MSDHADLNELSDEPLRLALKRALERNAHVERLLAAIATAVGKLDEFKLEWMNEERFVKLAYDEFDSVERYRAEQSWVMEERGKQEDGETPYPLEHECPFFSERFLYSVFGKEDARSILSRFHEIQRLAEEDSDEMRRRRENKEEMVRTARTLEFYREKAGRLERALSTDPKDKFYNLPKSMTKKEAEAKLEEYRDAIVATSNRLAESVLWHFEDN